MGVEEVERGQRVAGFLHATLILFRRSHDAHSFSSADGGRMGVEEVERSQGVAAASVSAGDVRCGWCPV